jgi:hypothetical protein
MFRRIGVPLLLLAFAGCSDFSTQPERVPTSVKVSPQSMLVVEGDPLDVTVEVLDQFGVAFEAPPRWAGPHWRSSDPSVIRPSERVLEAIGPGLSVATATVGSLSGTVRIRVNPYETQLRIINVQLRQPNNPSSDLVPGLGAELLVGILADKRNFFQPAVRASFYRGEELLSVIDLDTQAESIPLEDVFGSATQWRAQIPGSVIEAGTSVTVEVDPERTIRRATGSVDRWPASGIHPLTVAEDVGLQIGGAYLVQSIQRIDGSVPLIEGRDALLRAFLVADVPNYFQPTLRATLYHDGSEVYSVVIPAGQNTMETRLEQGRLNASWNAHVPGSLIRPGLSMVVEVEPEWASRFRPGSTTRHPQSGLMELDVRAVPQMRLRMVPIHQAPEGTTGNISEANLRSYTVALEGMFPIQEMDVDIRVPYTTSLSARTASGWSGILSEIRALQAAEDYDRYYYGVLRAPQGTPYAGLGYVGWPAAIGYDAPNGAPETFVHELGHNFGIRHTPCGNPSGLEPDYPHDGASIGVFGYDPFSGTVKMPGIYRDVMSYCGPRWSSDWTYMRVLDFRNRWDWPMSGSGALRSAEPTLLVWGGVHEGRLVLEPSFEVETRPLLPRSSGPYRVRGFDEAGATLFAYGFRPEEMEHVPGSASFAFAIPARIAQPGRLARVELSGPEGVSSRTRRAAEGRPQVQSRSIPGGVEVRWDAAEHPVALIRDARTGQVLSFARGGRVTLPTRGRPFDVLLSDGVRSDRTDLRQQ